MYAVAGFLTECIACIQSYAGLGEKSFLGLIKIGYIKVF